ncbi:class I SAM-dependent methyltransferase [Thermodesulfobacteriota bacterium]
MTDDTWSDYEEFKTEQPLSEVYYNLVQKAIQAGVRRICGEVKLRKALDLGCGTGDLTRYLREVADSVVGVDGSTALIRKARQHPDQEALEFLQANVLDRVAMGRLPSGAFDLVTAAWLHNYMHTEEQHRQLLEEVLRLLAPEGRVAFLMPADAYTSVRTQRFAALLDWRQAWLEEGPEWVRGVFSFAGSPWAEMTVWQPIWIAKLYRPYFSLEFIDVKSVWLDEGGLGEHILEPTYEVMIGTRRPAD